MHAPEPALDSLRPTGRSRPQTRRPVAGSAAAGELLRLQRSAGNQATTRLLAQQVQRAVSHSASWRAANTSPEETLIGQIDALIPTAEAAAVTAVATTTGTKTPREANYIHNPKATTWGSVVEEKLDPAAQGAGWSTQHRLSGARPDYYRQSNGIEVYVDLTSAKQAGIGGNHITDKLDKAGFTSPNAVVAAADVTHVSTNPRGKAAAAVVLGNATQAEVNALQQYRRLTKTYENQTDVEFEPGIGELFKKYGDVKHDTFTNKWKANKRQAFTAAVTKSLLKPKAVDMKKHATRSSSKT